MPVDPAKRRWPALVLGLVLLHLVTVAWLHVPAPFSVDDVAYDWQARALSQGRLSVVNGDDAGLPGEATQIRLAGTLMRHQGSLQSKYPPGQALLAALPYRLLGPSALVGINALGTVALAGATWAMARRLGGAPRVAAVALILLLGGSQAWGYSLDLWPHASAAALQTWAFVLALGRGGGGGAGAPGPLDGAPRHADPARLFGAGLLAGVATSFRLDAVLGFFPIAALILLRGPELEPSAKAEGEGGPPCLPPAADRRQGPPGQGTRSGPRRHLRRLGRGQEQSPVGAAVSRDVRGGGPELEPSAKAEGEGGPPCLPPAADRLRAGAAFAAGAALPLGLLAAVNLHRFGSFSPFSYGGPADTSMGARFLPMAVAALGALVLLLLRGRARGVAALLGVAAACLLAGDTVGRVLGGAWTLLVDLRRYPMDNVEPAMTRGPAGEVVYLGVAKLAVLQGAPVTAAAILGILPDRAEGSARARPVGRRVASLFCAAVLLLGFGRTSWHGGLGFDLRYLLPLLPGAAVAAAFAVEPWWRDRATVLAGVVGAVLLLAAAPSLPWTAWSTLPMGLAAALVLAGLAHRAGLLRPAMPALLAGAALAWGGWVSVHHLEATRAVRAGNAAHAAAIGERLPERALLWMLNSEAAAALHARPGLVLSAPFDHPVEASRALRDAADAAGIPVYGAFPEDAWRMLAKMGLLEDRRLERIAELPGAGLVRRRALLVRVHPPAP